MRDLAKKICIYNGQRGTDKQIDRCIKGFQGSIEMMKRFASNRLTLTK